MFREFLWVLLSVVNDVVNFILRSLTWLYDEVSVPDSLVESDLGSSRIDRIGFLQHVQVDLVNSEVGMAGEQHLVSSSSSVGCNNRLFVIV